MSMVQGHTVCPCTTAIGGDQIKAGGSAGAWCAHLRNATAAPSLGGPLLGTTGVRLAATAAQSDQRVVVSYRVTEAVADLRRVEGVVARK